MKCNQCKKEMYIGDTIYSSQKEDDCYCSKSCFCEAFATLGSLEVEQ